MAGMFELFIDADNCFRFRLKGPDGAVVAVSKGFPDKPAAVAGIAAVREYAGMGLITDLTAGPARRFAGRATPVIPVQPAAPADPAREPAGAPSVPASAPATVRSTTTVSRARALGPGDRVGCSGSFPFRGQPVGSGRGMP